MSDIPSTPTPVDAVKPVVKPSEPVQPNSPQFWPEYRVLIENEIRNQPRELQTHIGPSELGTDCVSCLAKKLAGWPQKRTASFLTFIGTCVHEHFERMFRKLSESERYDKRFSTELRVNVAPLNGMYDGYDVTGSIDLYDHRNAVTGDWKIVGPTTLKNVKANGPSQQYRTQASLYGLGLRNSNLPVEYSAIYFLPRNSMTLNNAIPVEMPFDPKPGQWALSRAQLLVNLMDVIERADGADMRDAWIHSLPKTEGHCFDCGTWPDDDTHKLPEFDEEAYPDVPGRWLSLIPLIEPEYPDSNN